MNVDLDIKYEIDTDQAKNGGNVTAVEEWIKDEYSIGNFEKERADKTRLKAGRNGLES